MVFWGWGVGRHQDHSVLDETEFLFSARTTKTPSAPSQSELPKCSNHVSVGPGFEPHRELTVTHSLHLVLLAQNYVF